MQKEDFKKKVNYILCGIMTTMVNMGSFSVLVYGFCLGAAGANMLAWAVSVTFAFIANKIIVYHDFRWERSFVVPEALRFFLCRVASGALETIGVFAFCDVLMFSPWLVKVSMSLIVLCFNFICSEKLVFQKNKKNP